MAQASVDFTITGISPLLMHRLQEYLNKSNPLTIRYAEIMEKQAKKRTVAENDELSELDYRLGAYVDSDGYFFMPGELLDAAIIAGAKTLRKGKQAEAGMFCEDGVVRVGRDQVKLEDVIGNREFSDVRAVRVGQAKILRTRPRFNQWSVSSTMMVSTTQIDPSQVERAIRAAGAQCGIGDYRPRFGRFELTSFKVHEMKEVA